jgi:hypothetical protein
MKDVCPECRRHCSDPNDLLSIEKTGMCLQCDHVLGEILEDQLLDSDLERDDEV